MKLTKWTYLIIAFALLVITHQIFWCPIHGDGAFYAFIMKAVSSHPELPLLRPNGGPFFDHPYLFFFLSYPLTQVFGTSDWAIKIPNYIIGLILLYLVFLISKNRFEVKTKDPLRLQTLAWASGLVAIILILLGGNFEQQTRMPSLDPLAHLMALASVYIALSNKGYVLSGAFMGLAFLTKGAEMLPHLGALGLTLFYPFVLFKTRQVFLLSCKKTLRILIGLVMVTGAWLVFDYIQHIGWLDGYIQYQFKNRFFTKTNFEQNTFDFIFIKTLFVLYQPWLILLVGLVVTYFKKARHLPILWFYGLSYIGLTIIAFSLIKKDSLQHYMGIYIVGGIIISQALVWGWSTLQAKTQAWVLKASQVFMILLVTLSFLGSFYMWVTPYPSTDFWGSIKSAKTTFDKVPEQPIVIDPSSSLQEQIFWTGRWQWQNPIHWEAGDKRKAPTPGQEVFFVRASPNGQGIEVTVQPF